MKKRVTVSKAVIESPRVVAEEAVLPTAGHVQGKDHGRNLFGLYFKIFKEERFPGRPNQITHLKVHPTTLPLGCSWREGSDPQHKQW